MAIAPEIENQDVINLWFGLVAISKLQQVSALVQAAVRHTFVEKIAGMPPAVRHTVMEIIMVLALDKLHTLPFEAVIVAVGCQVPAFSGDVGVPVNRYAVKAVKDNAFGVFFELLSGIIIRTRNNED